MSDIQDLLNTLAGRRDETLLVVSGFDGVLVDYEPDPDTVHLSNARRDLLANLINRHATAFCVVSGRRARDLRNRIQLGEQVFYVGLHGFEAEGPGFVRVERDIFSRYPDRLHEIAVTLQPFMSRIAGVRMEDKGAAIALHTRQAGSADAVWARLRLLNEAADLLYRDELRAVRGNHVFELLPNVGFPRSSAITAVREFLEARGGRPVLTVYIGEDVPDDDAAEACDASGLCAVVGRRGPPSRFRLASIESVWELIAGLLSLPAAR